MEHSVNDAQKYVGFLLLHKPAGLTSFECISTLKRLLPKKTKIGHAGTLDAFAEGLLIIAIGRPATREIDTIMKLKKTYKAVGKLGEVTDTLDPTGTVIKTCDTNVTYDMLVEAAQSFGTSYKQIPPVFSALKHKGKRLSDLARYERRSSQELQKIAEEKARVINLYSLTIDSFDAPFFTLTAKTSHGTYIRVLVTDIAEQAGSCATTEKLIRSAIGPFCIEHAVALSSLKTGDDIISALVPVEEILNQIKKESD